MGQAASRRYGAALATTDPFQQPLADDDVMGQLLQLLGVHDDALLSEHAGQ